MRRTKQEIELMILKKVKREQILKEFLAEEKTPVEFPLSSGVFFKGGNTSITAIDKYVRLNRLAGNTTHTIWDVDKVDHLLTDTEINNLILTLGANTSTSNFKLKNRKLALVNATTISEARDA